MGFFVAAVVGAIIGGFAAALSGGDIGKGMLFGAVAGAVLYGVSNWAGANFGSTSSSNINPKVTEGVVNHETTNTIGSGVGVGSDEAANEGFWSSLWSDGSKDTIGGMLIESGIQGVGTTLSGLAQASAAEDAMNAQIKANKEEAEKSRAHEKEMLALQNEANTERDHELDKLAENRRQFDLNLGEERRQFDTSRKDRLDKIKTSGSALAQAKVSPSNTEYVETPSIKEQAQEQTSELYPTLAGGNSYA